MLAEMPFAGRDGCKLHNQADRAVLRCNAVATLGDQRVKVFRIERFVGFGLDSIPEFFWNVDDIGRISDDSLKPATV